MMSNSLKIVILLSVLSCSLHAQKCTDQVKKQLESECFERMGDFDFSDSYTISPSKFLYGGEYIEYKKSFFRGTTYSFVLSDQHQDEKRMFVEIYDYNHRLVASSFLKQKNKYYSKIFFPCKSSGTYYLRYGFKDHKPHCGHSVLGFKIIPPKKKPTAK